MRFAFDPSLKNSVAELMEWRDTMKPSPKIEVMLFPGGEPHVKVHNWPVAFPNHVVLDARPVNAAEFLAIPLLVEMARYYGAEVDALYIPYFPGARQDRDHPLTVKLYADIINPLEVPRVDILDPHSDVVSALVRNSHPVALSRCGVDMQMRMGTDYHALVAPDAGATKRVLDLARLLTKRGSNSPPPVLQALKVRDSISGQLSGFRLVDELPPGQPVTLAVVDDICDGGGTFIGLAKAIREQYPDREVILDLLVTHGIFSKGTEQLFEHYRTITSTNSFLSVPELEKLNVKAIQVGAVR